MAMTIDGRPNDRALVAVSRVGEKHGIDVEPALRKVAEADAGRMHGGTVWAPALQVTEVLEEAGLADARLYTEAGAKNAGFRRGAVQAAFKGQQQLFATALHEPVIELTQLESAAAAKGPAITAAAKGHAVKASAHAGTTLASATARFGPKIVPYALGALPTLALARHLTRVVGDDDLEPKRDQQVRRAGVLVGGALVSGLGGAALARAIAPELPRVAKVMAGVGVGGAVVGAIGLSAVFAIKSSE